MIPTLHEFAGIFMLALITTALLVSPSVGRPHTHIVKSDRTQIPLSAFSIDGIETVPLLSRGAR